MYDTLVVSVNFVGYGSPCVCWTFCVNLNTHGRPDELQISTRLPKLDVAIEREGHLHAFCCTVAGSDWVASHTATTIYSHVDL